MPFKTLSRFLFPKELILKKIDRLEPLGIRCHLEKKKTLEYCPKCATPSMRIHDYRKVRIKNEPIRGKAVFLSIKKRKLWCASCLKPFTEPIQKVPKGHRTTANYKRGIAWASENFTDLSRVRRHYRCSSSVLYKAVYDNYALKNNERKYPFPAQLGIDEHSIRKLRYSAVEYATVIVDHKNRRLFDVIEGRSKEKVRNALEHERHRENVKIVTLDFSPSYRSTVTELFPNAEIVSDRFHMQRMINRIVNKMRLRITGDDRKNPIRRLLLRNSDRLEPYEKRAIKRWLKSYPALEEAYSVKEQIYRFYKIKGYTRARRAFRKILDRMGLSDNLLLKNLREVYLGWKEEILNYFKFNRVSNGRTEGFNRKAKLVQRRAYGFRSFPNYRQALLHACR